MVNPNRQMSARTVRSKQLISRIFLNAFFALISLFAVFGGLHWHSRVLDEQASPPMEHAETKSRWYKSLERHEAGELVSPALARPMNLPILIQRHPGELGFFAFSREDLHPSTTTINGFSNEALLFRGHELENPAALLVGNLDLVFVAVVLLPLVICLLNYNQLSADRERGLLRVMIVNGCRPSRLLWQRVTQRSLPPLLVLWSCSILGAVLADGQSASTWIHLLVWCGALFVYWLFWIALSAYLASISSNSLNSALLAVSVWIAVVIVVPSGLQFVASQIIETPSAVRTLADARAAEGKALASLEERTRAFIAEHSSEIQMEDENVPSYYRRAYLSNEAINARISERIDIHHSTLRQGLETLDIVQVLSPSTAFFRSLQEIAGSGFRRANDFEFQTRMFFRKYFEAIRLATIEQRRLTLTEARAIDSFNYQSRSNWFSVSVVLSAMGVLALGLAVLASRQADRIATKIR